MRMFKWDILIAHEKHGDRYFDISSNSLLDGACRRLLQERFDQGWYDVGEWVGIY